MERLSYCINISCMTMLLDRWESKIIVVLSLQDNVIEMQITVDPKYHRHFVVRRGEVLRQISDDYGGVSVSFPRSGVKSDQVTLKGATDCVEAAKKRITEIVADLVRFCLYYILHRPRMRLLSWDNSPVFSPSDRVTVALFIDEYLSCLPTGGTGDHRVRHPAEVPPDGHGSARLQGPGNHAGARCGHQVPGQTDR